MKRTTLLTASALTLWLTGSAFAQETTKKPESAADGQKVTPVEITPTDRDVMAALRARISGGAIVFNGAPRLVVTGEGTAATATFRSPQFAQASTYFAFEAQPELLAFGNSAEGGYPRWTIEPLINFRMTAIPVSDGTDEDSPGTVAIAAPDASFVQSQKAAQVQLGGQVALHFPGMNVNGTAFHWSVAFTARRGFSNVTDGQRQQRVWDLDDDLFGSRMFGARLTLYHQASADSAEEGWTPAAYLDLGYGSYESFEIATGKTDEARACLADRNACLIGTIPSQDQFATKEKGRLYVEARLTLKNLYLGLDINNGSGRDDMRFIGGFTMTLDSIFGK